LLLIAASSETNRGFGQNPRALRSPRTASNNEFDGPRDGAGANVDRGAVVVGTAGSYEKL
jgi:hypothetical protein